MNRAARSTSWLYITTTSLSLLLSNLSITSNEEDVLVLVECSNLLIQFIWKGKEPRISISVDLIPAYWIPDLVSDPFRPSTNRCRLAG